MKYDHVHHDEDHDTYVFYMFNKIYWLHSKGNLMLNFHSSSNKLSIVYAFKLHITVKQTSPNHIYWYYLTYTVFFCLFLGRKSNNCKWTGVY